MQIELNIGIPLDNVSTPLARRTKRELCLQETRDIFESGDYVSGFQYRFAISQYTDSNGKQVEEDTLVVSMNYDREDILLDANALAANLGEDVIAVYYPETGTGECLGPARYDPSATQWEFDIQFFNRFCQA